MINLKKTRTSAGGASKEDKTAVVCTDSVLKKMKIADIKKDPELKKRALALLDIKYSKKDGTAAAIVGAKEDFSYMLFEEFPIKTKIGMYMFERKLKKEKEAYNLYTTIWDMYRMREVFEKDKSPVKIFTELKERCDEYKLNSDSISVKSVSDKTTLCEMSKLLKNINIACKLHASIEGWSYKPGNSDKWFTPTPSKTKSK
jgi:hypothetical protein